MPSLSLTHVLNTPREGFSEPPPALVLLHGLGSNEHDLLGLAPFLDPRLFILSLRAPFAFDEAYAGAYAWFGMEVSPMGWAYNPIEAEESRRILVSFLDEATAAYDLDPPRIYLMGFSQGAAMALAVALTAPKRLSGVVAMSGSLLPETLENPAAPEDLDGLPILMTHGTHDEVVPVALGRMSRDRLQSYPVRLDFREYPMVHEVSEASLRDVSGWLAERLEDSGVTDRNGRPR
ncbi:MAG: alpha/beta fold hydrolase [Armatimonadetes bacterium]|nr:alpha/beta fold hydrolase [Armatimonadota bacterium]